MLTNRESALAFGDWDLETRNAYGVEKETAVLHFSRREDQLIRVGEHPTFNRCVKEQTEGGINAGVIRTMDEKIIDKSPHLDC